MVTVRHGGSSVWQREMPGKQIIREQDWAPKSPSQVPIDPISFHRLQLFKVLTLSDSATGSGPSL